MSVSKIAVMDGGMPRQIQQGDVVALGEVIPATIATNAIPVTAGMLAAAFIQRTTTGAGTDTIDTAANIIAGITQGLGAVGIQNGITWRIKYIQNAAFAITVQATANTGVTVNNGTINASSVKEFLLTIVNGSPARAVTSAVTTNASAVVTGLSNADAAAISAGMIVTNAVAGLQGATVLGVNVNAGSVTMSTNATSTLSAQTINFSPIVTLTGVGQGLL